VKATRDINMSEMHFDAVIVGSGFGGSVMAYRLAEAGFSVCLLERGKAYPPGSFPRSPYRMKNNFWDPSEGLYGMYNVWSFDGINSIVSSGLGGGSLIYANVLLRKDEKWFVHEDIHNGGYEYWPVSRADLDPHYDRVERMMNAQYFPFDRPPYNKTSKTIALRKAAEQLQMDWFLPKLAITFGNEGEAPTTGEPIREEYANIHGRTRYTCRMCGECDIGCNYGSKNTLDYTYLSAAKRHQAEIWTCCEVRSFKPTDGGRGYTIHYVQHDPEKEGQKLATHDPAVLPIRTITADRLILSAGTFGSAFLMLKNHRHFPGISKLLGTRFSGNGDLINFALKCSDCINDKREPRVIDGGNGPVITSSIRFSYMDGDEERGFYIQDAGYPEFVNWMLQIFDSPSEINRALHVAIRLVEEWFQRDLETDLSGYISSMFGTCELSSGLLPMLGMGRDIPDGRMTMQDNMLRLDWTKKRSRAYFDRLRAKMLAISDTLGATFQDNPLWYFNRLVTAHPLGGCPMGRDITEGVVNPYGEVFNYPNFYIADGSIMPGPAGANPSLTIAALADRFADSIIEKRAAQA
jgi:cholesterol oxidase